uniref:Uncharacterized protein n=1 Tax=Oryza brachyantha TaxID=4533 RepID=J3MDS7_ORYBR
RADGDPEEGDGDGDEARPDVDDGGGPAAAAHEALGEGVVVRQHPEAEEPAAEQLAVLRDLRVHRPRHADDERDDVDPDHGQRRDEERRPLDQVQLRERVVVVVRRRLGRQREGDLDACHHLEQALQHRRQVRRRAADHPELLVPPPLLQPDPGPLHLEQAQQHERDGDEQQIAEEGRVQRRDDELAGEEGQRRQEAVHDEEEGGEGVDADVEVRHALQELEPPRRQQRVVLGEEDLHRPRR